VSYRRRGAASGPRATGTSRAAAPGRSASELAGARRLLARDARLAYAQPRVDARQLSARAGRREGGRRAIGLIRGIESDARARTASKGTRAAAHGRVPFRNASPPRRTARRRTPLRQDGQRPHRRGNRGATVGPRATWRACSYAWHGPLPWRLRRSETRWDSGSRRAAASSVSAACQRRPDSRSESPGRWRCDRAGTAVWARLDDASTKVPASAAIQRALECLHDRACLSAHHRSLKFRS